MRAIEPQRRTSTTPVTHLLTIDLEDWYHASLMERYVDRSTATRRVPTSAQTLLDLLDEAGARASVFVLGRVAEAHPATVRAFAERGHEIASHGYDHRLAYQQSEEQFEEDLLQSISKIGDATGVRPVGYRAPSWSITRSNLWAFNVLRRNGFLYDSSIFPFKTFLYGISGAPRRPFRIRLQHGFLLEFPASTLNIHGLRLPFSGGFYFRVLPYAITRMCFRRFAREDGPAMLYAHPWEVDPSIPRVKGLRAKDYLIHYTAMPQMEAKLRRVLRDFRFSTIMERIPLLEASDALRTVAVADLQRAGR